MNIGFIILVRTDSKRLKNKTLINIYKDKKLIDLVINNILETFPKNYKLVVATTSRKVDKSLVRYIKSKYSLVEIFEGNYLNVALRFLNVMKKFKFNYAVRVNGDSPLMNMHLIKKNLKFLKKEKYDIITNVYNRSYPKGQSIEIISQKILSKYINNISKSKIDKENVTSYFYKKKIFNKLLSRQIKNKKNFSNVNLSIDDKKDLKFLKTVVKKNNKPNLRELLILRKKFDKHD